MNFTPPVYDGVYFQGVAWLDDLARCDGYNPCGDCCRCVKREACGACPACKVSEAESDGREMARGLIENFKRGLASARSVPFPVPLVQFCVVCERKIEPAREDAPAHAEVRAHKRCVSLR